MAKKKSASSAASTSSPAAPVKSTAKKSSSANSASNGDSSSAANVLGEDQIGMSAGNVWLYLSDNGPTSLATLKKEVGGSSELLFAAVGWLAREEKLDFRVSGKTVTLALK